MYIHGMKFSLEVVSIKVKSFMKIKRKGFVMKGGETRSPPGSVSRVNVSSSLLAICWPSTGFYLNVLLKQPHEISQTMSSLLVHVQTVLIAL